MTFFVNFCQWQLTKLLLGSVGLSADNVHGNLVSFLVIVHFYSGAFGNLGVDDEFGEFILEIFLDGTFERPGAELLVVAALCDIGLGFVGKVESVAERLNALVESGELYVYNPEDSFLVELVKHYDIVDTIEELGRESLLQGFLEHTVGIVLVIGRGGSEAYAGAEVLELTVMIRMVFLKSIRRPRLSVSRPSSIT